MDEETLLAALRRWYPCGEPRELGFGRQPAVLVVDFIEGFTNPKSPLAGTWNDEVRCTATLLDCARSVNVPVVFTVVELSRSELATHVLHRKTPRIGILLAGSDWTSVDHRLAPEEQDLIISKKHGSAFFGTDLASQLRTMAIDSLLLCGCVTSGCVRATAVDAAQHGFRTAIVREAVADRSRLANETNLIDIEQRYGDVVTLEHALNYLRSHVPA